MSGIVGIVNLDGAPVEEAVLRRMTASMARRGPDGCTMRLDGSVGFGHRLLRRCATSADEERSVGHDGVVWITADALLDARADLVRTLEAHRARAIEPHATDADLILHAYEIWGEDCVDHLLGDFTFAIWDGRRRALFCARDHLGIKPFYYARAGHCLVFSNTLNCVRLHPAVSDTLNESAVGDFLLFGFNQDVATTTFADIQRLPPAHALTWSAGSLRLRRYWTLPAGGQLRHRRADEYLDEFRTLWRASVNDRLRADRVGVLMSGGLDSTSVAATAHGCLSARRKPFALRAYTLVYERLLPDRERHYAGLVSDALGIGIHYLAADAYALFDRLDEAACQTPEPSDNPLPAMSADLLREVASDCRLALSGEGGDAALASPSPSHFAALLEDRRVGAWLMDVARCLASGARPPLGIRGALKRWTGKRPSVSAYPAWISPDFAARIDLPARWRQHLDDAADAHRRHTSAYRSLRSPYWPAVFETYDPGYTSLPLQFRHPFFDVRLLTFLLAVPPIPWLLDKKILREGMRGSLPEAVRTRPKTPIAAEPVGILVRQPAARWLNAFEPVPELLEYVDLSKVPRVAGLPQQADAYGFEWHLLTRPLSLNSWLARTASSSQAKKELFDGELGAVEKV